MFSLTRLLFHRRDDFQRQERKAKRRGPSQIFECGTPRGGTTQHAKPLSPDRAGLPKKKSATNPAAPFLEGWILVR